MIDLDAMAVFVRVVETESFSAAARGLDLSPSAVSKQVSRLENQLGVRLLHRTTRKLGLTDAGSTFFQRATRLLADAEDVERSVADLGTGPRGRLRVSLPLAFGRVHVTPVLVDFLRRYPEIQLDVSYADTFVDLVAEGFDVAVRIGDLADSSLIARRLAQNRRAVVGSASYFAQHGRPLVPADLADHNCFLYAYRQERNRWGFLGPEGGEIQVAVRGALETNESEVLHAFVRAGLGIALIPLWLVGPDLAAGRLEEVLSDHHVPDKPIQVVYPSGRHLSPKVRAFVDILVERFRDWPA